MIKQTEADWVGDPYGINETSVKRYTYDGINVSLVAVNVFDQTFSKETQQGLIVTGSISKDELKIVLVPTVDHNLKPQLATGDERQVLVDRICENIQEYCDSGVVTIP